MAAPKTFRSVFTEFERRLVLALAKKNKDIIEKKETNKVLNAQKSLCWLDIEREFNSVTGVRTRSAKQLKQCYENMKKRMKAKNGSETYRTARNASSRTDQALFESAVLELDVLNVPVPNSNSYDSESCFVLPDNNEFEGSKETAAEVITELTEPTSDQADIDIKPTLATDGSIILTPPEEPQLTNKSTSMPPKRCGFYKQSVWRRKEPMTTARTSSAVEICTAQEDYYKEKLKFEKEEHELRKCLLLEKIKFMQNLNASVEKHPERNKFYLSETL